MLYSYNPAGCTIQVDWLYVRQYRNPEPTATITSYDIRESRTVSGTGLITFDDDAVVTWVDVTTPGSLTGIRVIRHNHDHPNATDPIKTGRYWEISTNDNPGAYVVSLILPHNSVPDSLDKICLWLGGSGLNWSCAMSSFDPGAGTITLTNISQLSDWATGNNVGPTSLTLLSFHASSYRWITFPVLLALLLVCALAALGLAFRQRRNL